MNLYLTCEFLARLSASQVGLRDYLQRPSLVFVVVSLNGLDSLDFVALGESSLAEEAPFLVLDVAWRLAFRQFTNFLFNNVWTIAVVSATRLLLLLSLRLGVASGLAHSLRLGCLLPLLLVAHHRGRKLLLLDFGISTDDLKLGGCGSQVGLYVVVVRV